MLFSEKDHEFRKNREEIYEDSLFGGTMPMVNRIVHFDIEVSEPEKVIDFYQNVFDWKIQKLENWNSDYWTISTGDEEDPGIDGGLSASQDGKPNTVNTIEVADILDYTGKIVAAGGKVVTDKHLIPGVGYIAYCEDPQGYLFGLFEGSIEDIESE